MRRRSVVDETFLHFLCYVFKFGEPYNSKPALETDAGSNSINNNVFNLASNRYLSRAVICSLERLPHAVSAVVVSDPRARIIAAIGGTYVVEKTFPQIFRNGEWTCHTIWHAVSRPNEFFNPPPKVSSPILKY